MVERNRFQNYSLLATDPNIDDDIQYSFNPQTGALITGAGGTWGAINPDTGMAWGATNNANPSWASTSYNPQPGFTAGTGSMGYNIAPTAQGVAPYSTEAPLSTDIANPFIDYLPQEFLEQTPSAAYYSVPSASEFYTRPSGTIDPSKKKFYQESFQDIYTDYLGKLGGMAREGKTPDLKFTDYLSQKDPFTERYARLSPYERGMNTGYYAPKTRFIYY